MKSNIYSTPLYKAIDRAVKLANEAEEIRDNAGTLSEDGIKIISGTEKQKIEDAKYEKRKAKGEVIKLIQSGALKDNDELLPILIGRMGLDVYMYALGNALDTLGPDAIGLGIMEALKKGDNDAKLAVQLMLDSDTPVTLNVQDVNGYTPLDIAMLEENFDINIVHELLKAGADPKGFAPAILELGDEAMIEAAFHSAVRNGNIEAVRLLIPHVGPLDNIVDKYGMTPLMLAVSLPDGMGAGEMTKLVLSKTMSVHGKDEAGLSALTMAASRGRSDIVKLLLDRKAVVDSPDKENNTPLMYAVINGDIETVRALIDKGADVNAADHQGKFVLELAHKHQDVVDLLKEKGAYSYDIAITQTRKDGADGADANRSLNKNGATLLMLAAKRNDFNNTLSDAVALTTKYGADPNIEDEDGKTALTYAKDEYVMKWLIIKGADPYTAGLIKEVDGKIAIDEGVTDEKMRDVLLGYVKAEQEFKEKFADRIINGIKKEDITFSNIDNKVSHIIKGVLKEGSEGKFANIIKQTTPSYEVKLAFIDKFILALKDLLPETWVKNSMESVKKQLNEAVQKMDVFKPLSPELEQELKTFAQKVSKSGEGFVQRG